MAMIDDDENDPIRALLKAKMAQQQKEEGEQLQDPRMPSSFTPGKNISGVLQHLIGDKRQEEGVTESLSPIDFLPVSEMASLGIGAAKAAGRGIAEAAPRLLGNEVGAIGRDIGGLIKHKQMGQGITSVGEGIKLIPTAEQDLAQQMSDKYANSPKDFFDKRRNVATQNGIGASPLEKQQFDMQKISRDERMAKRNSDQLAQAKDIPFQKLKRVLVK